MVVSVLNVHKWVNDFFVLVFGVIICVLQSYFKIMFKKTIAISGTIAILSFALPALAQTNDTSCGFWANLFGRCGADDQSANILDARLGSTSRESKEPRGIGKQASTTKNAATTAQIQCVGSAVATREASLVAGMSAFNTSINTAYSTRSVDLATAYSKTTGAEVRGGISVAWKSFNTSTKSAQKTWRTTRESAWSTFKTSAKACKGTESVTDSANSVTEMSGA